MNTVWIQAVYIYTQIIAHKINNHIFKEQLCICIQNKNSIMIGKDGTVTFFKIILILTFNKLEPF